MPEDERERMMEEVANFEGLTYQWAIFRRGWSASPSGKRIQMDPETAGPRLLVRAYATAEAETVRMRGRTRGRPADAGQQPSLEEKLRRRLRPAE